MAHPRFAGKSGLGPRGDVILQTDWSVLEDLNVADLLASLVSYLPLGSEDKQLLLEADTLAQRVLAFTALIDGESQGSSAAH